MSSQQRRFQRVRGPFDGYLVRSVDMAVKVYDLNEGGCFVGTLDDPPDDRESIVVRVDVPHEGWMYLQGDVLYARPEFGFAVRFKDMPQSTRLALNRGLTRLLS
jgi:hypothetical protein